MSTFNILLIFILHLVYSQEGSTLTYQEEGPTLSLPIGTISGHYRKSRNGKVFSAYEGVPYAQPPTGDLRWKAALPALPWEGVKNCTVTAPICTQNMWYVDNAILGQEDCLYLNIHYPRDMNISSLPVMVWIHGGGLVAGAGSNYGPEFLMDEGVAVVTINYRMGALGFMSFDSPEYSGNQGLRDQVLALTWVQENLSPEKVTIFGESAGSWSISHHILSPQSEGLFQAAIGQSGSMNNGLAFQVISREDASNQGKSFAIFANCSDGSTWNEKAVLDCLKKKSAAEIIHLADQFGFITMGSVDDFSSGGPILPAKPEELLEFGLFNQVPTIWGTNLGEGSLWFPDVMKDPSLLDKYDAIWDVVGPPMMFYINIANQNNSLNDFGPHDVEYAMAARDFYFDGAVSGEKLTNFVDLLTDTYFLRPVHKMSLSMSDFAPVYQYMLTFRDNTSFNEAQGPPNLVLGPTHGADIQYLFIYPLFNFDYSTWSQANIDTSLRMCKMWANFAKSMNPTPGDEMGIKWEKVSREDHKYLNIGKELAMEMTEEYKQRMQFWDNIVIQTSEEFKQMRDLWDSIVIQFSG